MDAAVHVHATDRAVNRIVSNCGDPGAAVFAYRADATERVVLVDGRSDPAVPLFKYQQSMPILADVPIGSARSINRLNHLTGRTGGSRFGCPRFIETPRSA